MSGRQRSLRDVLEEARALGLLGPGPVEGQIAHATDLGTAIGSFAGRMLDLGSGGGLPGLVLFTAWPEVAGVLLDAQRRRCDFLHRAILDLGLGDRVEVRCGRAEVLARDAELRAAFDLVVARSFGPPAVTAECAVGFLRAGGDLVVTEPPDGGRASERWDASGLESLGFGRADSLRSGGTGAVKLHLERAAEDRWPRRDGVPSKRPLW